MLGILARYKTISPENIDLIIFCAKVLINSHLPECVLGGAEILKNITNTSDDDIIIKAASGNIIPKLMQHMSTYAYTNKQCLQVCSTLFANYTSSNHVEVLEKILNNGILDRYLQLLQQDCPELIVIETLWSLSNIAADSENLIEFLQAHNIMQSITEHSYSTKPKVREEALMIISNICFTGSPRQVLKLLYG